MLFLNVYAWSCPPPKWFHCKTIVTMAALIWLLPCVFYFFIPNHSLTVMIKKLSIIAVLKLHVFCAYYFMLYQKTFATVAASIWLLPRVYSLLNWNLEESLYSPYCVVPSVMPHHIYEYKNIHNHNGCTDVTVQWCDFGCAF